MKGRVIADWTRVDFNNPTSRKQVIGALQHFMTFPANNPVVRAATQHFATTGDFPASVLNVMKEFQATDHYDNAFEDIFDIMDMRNSARNGFEIVDVEDGLTFDLVAEGSQPKIRSMSGSKTTVSMDMYGGGLQWSRRLIDDREYWTLEKNAIAFRNKFYASRAQSHYDLIDAIGSGRNLTWQAAVPSGLATSDANYVAIRDMETINKACTDLLITNKDKGWGLNANSQFLILAPIQLRSRLERALGILNGNLAGASYSGVRWNVTIRWSLQLSSATTYYVCIPKQKAMGATRMDLTILDQFDPTRYTDVAVGWARYGAAIGDTEQFLRCATS